MSDLHENYNSLRRALKIVEKRKVEDVIFLGDFINPSIAKELFSSGLKVKAVFGNNDGDKIALQKMAQGKIENSPCIETYDQKKILIGHHFETLEALIASQEFYLIVYGHIHKAEIRNEGKTLVVNPGECGGWVEGKSTIAVVDLETQKAEIIELT